MRAGSLLERAQQRMVRATARGRDRGGGVTVRINKAMEDEVSASLGGLLGLLEVLAIDAEPPLSTRQQHCLDEALRLGDALRAKVEALVTLLSDEADPRFAKTSHALRRLIDHAVRAAGWSAS